MAQQKVRKVTKTYVSLKVCDELYDLLDAEAEKQGVYLIDVAVRAIAEHFKRPDLGRVPRDRRGGGKKEKQPA